ncbi:MAG TPA: substrate-binding domain-containing protein [Ottowia sp.]|nr:substrate-binding domain-containing protein [Ottowia sp.]
MNRRNLVALAISLATVGLPALAQTKTPTIGVSLASDLNPFYIAMKRGMQERAKELGVNVVFVTANEDVAKQVDGIRDLVARKVDGILASPIDSVAVGNAYTATEKAGIPIISIARHANSPAQSAFVAMDEPKIGGDIATWIIKHINGKGKIAMVNGPAGAATFRAIASGMDAVLKANPNVSVVYRKDAALTREMGLKLAEDALVAHPDLVAIYAANDELALGAAQAVKAAGKSEQIVITGMNGIPPALNAVKSGALGMTVELNAAVWGKLGIDTMVNYLKGQKPTGVVAAPYLLVDKTNVEQVLAQAKR